MIDGFREVSRHRWEIPREPGMNVPGILYASRALLDAARKDKEVLNQIRNVARLPGIVGASMAMPDAHWGYGFPIGGVAAFDAKDGIISPGGVGYDINCGVRLAATGIDAKNVRPILERVVRGLFNDVPCGLNQRGPVHRAGKQLDRVLVEGASAMIDDGFGRADDLRRTEAGGRLPDADPAEVSIRAHERGGDQIGTLGSGNHFLEIDEVDEIYDEACARAFGLRKGQLVLFIHSGSRGLGHQVCQDFVARMKNIDRAQHLPLPDTQLAYAPFADPSGQAYFHAMCAAANFAWANRQTIMHLALESLKRTIGVGDDELAARLVYDVAHNIAKIEEHEIDGQKRTVIVHRKGATRAFPPGHPELPKEYREAGQPVMIPGDMGRASFVLAGRPGSMTQTFGSCCHGAGRRLSRTQARKIAQGRSIADELAARGIVVECHDKRALAEEMPEAYKDAADVVRVIHEAGIAARVARLRPMGVIKG
ncbi:RtcB family protein [bacterium]|nr:RtcB family protein [bacterium]